MGKPLCAGLLLIVAGSVLTWSRPTSAGQEKAPPLAFAGKIVLLQSKSHPVTIENPVVKQLGDRWFVTGKSVRSEVARDWFVGSTVWMPVTEVDTIAEFEDMEQLRKILRKESDGGK